MNKRLLLIGGNEWDDAIFYRIKDLAGQDHAKIGVVTSAEYDPEESAANYIEDFIKMYGLKNTEWLKITTRNQNSKALANKIKEKTCIFLAGGNQERYLKIFYTPQGEESLVMKQIKKSFAEGLLVVGTSAGALMCQGKHMIAGGESYQALTQKIYQDGYEKESDAVTFHKQSGFDFLSQWMIDTHFSKRGRQGRLVRLAWEMFSQWAIGIDEDTSVVIQHVGEKECSMEVIGTGGVTIFNLEKTFRAKEIQERNFQNICLHYLTNGDQFFPYLNQFIIAPNKQSNKGAEKHEKLLYESDDIFSSPLHANANFERLKPYEFVHLTKLLMESQSEFAVGKTYENNPRYIIKLRKVAETESFFTIDSHGKETASITHLMVDILPQS